MHARLLDPTLHLARPDRRRAIQVRERSCRVRDDEPERRAHVERLGLAERGRDALCEGFVEEGEGVGEVLGCEGSEGESKGAVALTGVLR